MKLLLRSLQFRLPDGFALPLRKNLAGGPIQVPEWRAGLSQRPEDSPVLYRSDLANNGGLVEAVLEFSSSDVGPVFIRALDGAGGNFLGEIPQAKATLDSGGATTVRLPFERSRLSAVGRHDDVLHWQYRLTEDEFWHDLAMTRHRIYVGLGLPTSPWSIDAGDGIVPATLPWTDVLDWACQWAAGARSIVDAAEFVTRSFYGLGRAAAGARPHYTETSQYSSAGPDYYFDCSNFLNFLNGNRTAGSSVNCSDSASVVSTFANVLGCRLWQARLAPIPCTNPILLIGQTTTIQTLFTYHEVAWGGNAGAEDPLWDGCLMIDGDSVPAGPPFAGIVATNVPFAGELQYRDRLASKSSALVCVPKGMLAPEQNRPLTPGLVLPEDPERLAALRAEYNFAAWADPTTLPQALFVWRLFLNGQEFPHLSPVRNSTRTLAGVRSAIDAMLRPPNGADPLIRLETFAYPSRRDARRGLLEHLGEISSPAVRIEQDTPGDVAFASRDGESVVFARGNLVVRISSVGVLPIPVGRLPHVFDSLLIDTTLPPGLVAGPSAISSRLAPVPIELPSPPPDRKVWYRLFSPTGEVTAAGEQLMYTAKQPGPQIISFFLHEGPTAFDHRVQDFQLQ